MSDFFTASVDEQIERMTTAAGEVLAHWNLDGATLELIKYRENAVFSVERDDFRGALRLHRSGYHSDAELRSELQWMQALDSTGIQVPEPIATATDDLFVRHSSDGLPGPLQVDLFKWIDGAQLGSVEGRRQR